MRLLVLFTISVLTLASPPVKANFVECEACRLTLLSLRDYVRELKHWEWLANYTNELCLKFEGESYSSICPMTINEFKPIIADLVIDRLIDPEYLCVELKYCTSPKYIPENFTAYTERIMKGKPSGPGPQPSGGKTFRFLHISDIHMDMYYKEGTLDPCGQPMCCRFGNGTEGATAGYWGGHNCDLPLRTLYAGLKQIKEMNPDFILVTGDFASHDIWNQTKEYILEYQDMVSTAFKNTFTDTPIYTIFGNHACVPINQCTFGLDYWLPKAFSKYWNLSDLELLSLQLHAGYIRRHKLTNLKIMILDTNVFNAGDFYLMQNNTNPMGQLDWIYSELLTAEKNKEQIYIMGHMPTGDVDALPTWSKHFDVIVDRFEYTIAGMFFGHSHNDEIHIHRGVYTNLPTKVQWVAPSFTTHTNINPSFRMFQADEETKALIDFTQYRLNLTNANLNPSQQPVWDAVYSFKEFYGTSDISASSVYEIALLMGDNEQQSLRYLSNFYTAGNDTPNKCDHKCQHFNTCRMTYANMEDILKCQGPTVNGLFFEVNDWLYANWTYKVK